MDRGTVDSDDARIDCFFQRRGLLISVIGMLALLLIMVGVATLVGPGLEQGRSRVFWVFGASLVLLAIFAAFVWMAWKRPVALKIGPDGVDLPLVFKHPLAWRDIHRIRREQSRADVHGAGDWLIIDPAPGVLAPLRLPVWRWLEIKWQKHHGVRIPLHGLDGKSEDIIASIERFRDVSERESNST